MRQYIIAHNMLAPGKRRITKSSGALRHVSKVICLADVARDAYQQYYNLRQHQLQTIHYGIDTQFFHPLAVPVDDAILSIGSSKRDYGTLFAAVDGLKVKLRTRMASGWNPHNVLGARRIPQNVEVMQRCSFTQLREWYARSRFVVVPLRPTLEFTAGITSALEASATGKAVVATDTPGMREYVRDGETGILVEPRNPSALRNAIQRLLDDPQEAIAMGQRGRQWVERERSLDRYVTKVSQTIMLDLWA